MVKKELKIYVIIFVISSIIIHIKQWFSYPIEHFNALFNSSTAFGFDFLHPIIFSFFIYLLILIPRALIKGLKKLKK